MTDQFMTKSEREDLQRLVRQREKVLKSAAKQRSAELRADFENQLGSLYEWDQDEVWEAAKKLADAEVAKANARIAVRSQELGIVPQFAPRIGHFWFERGQNALAKRREELRKMPIAELMRSRRKLLLRSIEFPSRHKRRSRWLASPRRPRAHSSRISLPSTS